MKLLNGLSLFTMVVLLAGCAGMKKAAEPHPLVGAWEYSIDTPIGLYQGDIVVSEAEGVLSALMSSSEIPGELEVTDLMFEDNNLSFSFDSGEYGVMDVSVVVDGDTFTGEMDAGPNGSMPFSGKRKMAEE